MASAADPFIEIRGLSKYYGEPGSGVFGLQDIDLDISRGEFAVLLGPSGCGKTTLLRCIAGLERPQAGSIRINGRTVFSSAENIWIPPEKRNLSMVFQAYALWPHMTVAENVAFPLRSHGMRRAEALTKADDVLNLVGLGNYANTYPGQLSGGQQQRVALARAIVGQSDVVLFDEPMSNLDAKVRESLRAELSKLQRTLGFSAVFVTHDQEEAMVLGDKIVVMERGNVAQIGDSRTIYARPSSRYVAQFIGRMNEVPARIVAADAAFLTLETAFGSMKADRPAGEWQVGQTVLAMFRPHHARLTDATGLQGEVQRAVFLGTEVDLIAMAGGVEVTVCADQNDDRTNGSAVHFELENRHVQVYPVTGSVA